MTISLKQFLGSDILNKKPFEKFSPFKLGGASSENQKKHPGRSANRWFLGVPLQRGVFLPFAGMVVKKFHRFPLGEGLFFFFGATFSEGLPHFFGGSENSNPLEIFFLRWILEGHPGRGEVDFDDLRWIDV